VTTQMSGLQAEDTFQWLC